MIYKNNLGSGTQFRIIQNLLNATSPEVAVISNGIRKQLRSFSCGNIKKAIE